MTIWPFVFTKRLEISVLLKGATPKNASIDRYRHNSCICQGHKRKMAIYLSLIDLPAINCITHIINSSLELPPVAVYHPPKLSIQPLPINPLRSRMSICDWKLMSSPAPVPLHQEEARLEGCFLSENH